MTATPPLHADPRKEATELVEEATGAGVALRVTGGVAVSLICPSAASEPLARPVKDLDLVGRSKERKAIEQVLTSRGYQAEERFNLLSGGSQLMFADPYNGRQVDVFLDELNMCHQLQFADRLDLHDVTLNPTDLLLSKLQIVQVTDKDLQDILAILLDCEVDRGYIAKLLAGDWGWWRTTQGTLNATEEFAQGLLGPDGGLLSRAREKISELRAAIDAAPKSLKWKARDKVGERKRWYELPEDTR